MLAITGATGQLGRHVIAKLLETVPADEIIAAVRDPAKAEDLAAKGIIVREADYDRPETLETAFRGIDKLLLISSSEVGGRTPQHKAVIDAAKHNDVKLIVYTSILHADTSPLGLAEEHRETENAIRASGLPSVMLRNGWYTENYAAAIPAALEHGVQLGAAGDGRISCAARRDYAEAAAAVLLSNDAQDGKVYELAGDDSFTLTEFAAEVSRQSGKSVEYKNLPEAEYRNALIEAGFPEPVAALLADSDAGAAQGGLFDDSGDLHRLIGRPTTPLKEVIATTLRAL